MTLTNPQEEFPKTLTEVALYFHKKLANEGNKKDIINKLLRLNGLRVFLWS